MGATIAIAGLSSLPAEAQQYTLRDVCDTYFTCSGMLAEGTRTCWCEIDWNQSGAWQLCILSGSSCASYEEPPTSFPDASTDIAIIEHSSTDSRCDGGVDNGTLCNDDGDCTETCDNPGGPLHGSSCAGAIMLGKCTGKGGTCVDHFCEPEQYLLINISKDLGDPLASPPVAPAPITIESLTIKSEASGSLDIRFESGNEPLDDPQVSEVLTVGNLTIDGTNGAVEMRVTDLAEVKTDTTD